MKLKTLLAKQNIPFMVESSYEVMPTCSLLEQRIKDAYLSYCGWHCKLLVHFTFVGLICGALCCSAQCVFPL